MNEKINIFLSPHLNRLTHSPNTRIRGNVFPLIPRPGLRLVTSAPDKGDVSPLFLPKGSGYPDHEGMNEKNKYFTKSSP